MARKFWKGSVLLAPVPAVLVSSGSLDKPNVMTAAWTGIICTHPPMTYVSVRPERLSYEIISRTGEFVINLTTADMCRAVDLCGVKGGRDTDKIGICGFTLSPSEKIAAPAIEQSPVSLECKVTEAKALGSHTMFMAEIAGIQVDEALLDSNDRLDLRKCGLLAYSHVEIS